MDSNERALMVALATDFSFCLFCPALVMYSCPSVRRNFRLLFKRSSESLSPVSSDNHRIQSTKHPKVGLEFNIKGCVLLYSDFLKIATLEDTFPNIIQEDKDEHQEFINQIIQGYEWLLWIPKGASPQGSIHHQMVSERWNFTGRAQMCALRQNCF